MGEAILYKAGEADWHKILLIYEADGYDRAAAGMRVRAPKELEEFHAGDRVLFLAEVDSLVVGTVGLAFRGLDAGLADGVISANVTRLHVVQAERRKGTATALMVMAEDEALARGFRWVTIEVEDDNVPGKALYEKLGYGHTGPGRDPANIAMAKHLEAKRPR